MEEAQKCMLDMATELRELRGLPKAIQKQFEEHQERSEGKDKGKPGPLLTMSQWKELLESNKKATSLPPTPVKAGLFTAACANIKTHFAACIADPSSLDKHDPVCVDDSGRGGGSSQSKLDHSR